LEESSLARAVSEPRQPRPHTALVAFRGDSSSLRCMPVTVRWTSPRWLGRGDGATLVEPDRDPSRRNGSTRGVASRIAVVTFIWVLVAGLAGTRAPTASADPWALNGTFQAQSNGQWAMTNDRYQDEHSVISTWTISTTCSAPNHCVGQVISDQGWSAPIDNLKTLQWSVRRTVPNWEPCPDGTAADGEQLFQFYSASPDGQPNPDERNVFVGEDRTTGPSGACGISRVLAIRIPFKLRRIQ